MAVNSDLSEILDLLACPACRSPLVSESADIRCQGCSRTFPFHGRVPVLLDGDGFVSGPSLLGRLPHTILRNPRVYEFHQAHGGGRPIAAQVAKALNGVAGGTLLDIGAGTGMVGGLVPPETRYVWLDNDTLKLRGLLSRTIDCYAVLADAVRLPFSDLATDWTVMVEVSHHLPDGALAACLAEAARVTRNRFIFVDALRGTRLRSRLLWQLDLGRFPRTESELVGALETWFELVKVERFRVNHDHLLCVCSPRRKGRASSAA